MCRCRDGTIGNVASRRASGMRRVRYIPSEGSPTFSYYGLEGTVVDEYGSRVVIRLKPAGYRHNMFIFTSKDKIEWVESR